LTYPFIKGIAARLGITLVPLAMDANGVRPDVVQKAHREAHLSAVYIQPTVQNPLGMTMPPARRGDLLRVIEKLDLTVLEDAVYGFLDDEAPLAALAPDSCIVLDSLSKKVAPGLALGFIVAPPRWREAVMASVRSGGWTASGYAFAAGQQLMSDGTASELWRVAAARAVRDRAVPARRAVAEADRCVNSSATGGKTPLRLRDPGEQPILPFVADAAAILAIADIRRRRRAARYRVDALDDLRRHPWACPERGAAGAGRTCDRAARGRITDIVGNAECQGRGFRFDGIDRDHATPLTATPR
jgi:hypothetical protein